MPYKIDQTDLNMLCSLEGDAQLPVHMLAERTGVGETECADRMARLQRSGHIAAHSSVRNYPDAATRPISALISIMQDPGRTGHDLQRSLHFIPEITSAEVLDSDHTVLVRVQVPNLERLNEVTASFRVQSAVLSLEVATTKPLLIRRPSLHTLDRS